MLDSLPELTKEFCGPRWIFGYFRDREGKLIPGKPLMLTDFAEDHL